MITVIDLKFLGHTKVIAAFLVETKEGPVLIETGPHSTLPQLLAGIADAGHSHMDIKHVFLSHIHLDHAGAAWHFAKNGATIYVHPLGAAHLISPERLMASAKKIYQAEMDRLWGEMRPIAPEQVVAVDHKKRVKVGEKAFRALHTPGHAVHHIAWEYEKSLFTGDVAGVRITGGVVVPPCPPPDINVEDWKDSLAMIKKRRYKKLYLTHFGEVSKVREHLVELQGRLVNWANWIRPYCEQGVDTQAITKDFEQYVARQLQAGGIPEQDLERYEKANPAWMSVVGLMRYWKKKGVGTSGHQK